MDAIFNRYEKAQQVSEQHRASMNAEKERLTKLMDPIKELISQHQKAAPGSSVFTSLESQIAEMKQQHETRREAAEREYAQLEARNAAALYEEIQQTTANLAKAKGINYVVKVSPGPNPNSDPNAVMNALRFSVVYSDPRNDLTEEVIRELNHKFKAVGGKTAK